MNMKTKMNKNKKITFFVLILLITSQQIFVDAHLTMGKYLQFENF